MSKSSRSNSSFVRIAAISFAAGSVLIFAISAFASVGITKSIASFFGVAAETSVSATALSTEPAAPGTCDIGNNIEVEGTGGTNAGYGTLTEAFTAINAGTHTGTITIDVCGNTSEATGTAVLNSSGAGAASYTSISIRPAVDGVTIAGPTLQGRGVIEMNGADNVTIDGDNPNTAGINRNLTIQNTAANTINFTSVIRIAVAATLVNSADNNTIKNLNLLGSATGKNAAAASSSSGPENTTFGVFFGPGASTSNATAAPAAVSSVSAVAVAGAVA